jgi:hypothetical protein
MPTHVCISYLRGCVNATLLLAHTAAYNLAALVTSTPFYSIICQYVHLALAGANSITAGTLSLRTPLHFYHTPDHFLTTSNIVNILHIHEVNSPGTH